jgi:hypothetical protein
MTRRFIWMKGRKKRRFDKLTIKVANYYFESPFLPSLTLSIITVVNPEDLFNFFALQLLMTYGCSTTFLISPKGETVAHSFPLGGRLGWGFKTKAWMAI